MSAFVHDDQVKANISIWQMMKGLWPYGKGARPYFWVSVTAVLTVGITSRLFPTIIGYAIDEGILKSDAPLVARMAVAFCVGQLVYVTANFTYNYYFQKFGNRLLFNLRERLHARVQNLPMPYFDRTPTGRIITRLTNDTGSLGELAGDGLVNVLVDGVILISIVVAMVVISPLLALCVLLCTPLFVWFSVHLTNRMRDTLRDSKKKLSELNSFASERITGMKTVQILGLEDAVDRRYRTTSQDYRELVMRALRTSALLHPTMNIYNAVTIGIAIAVGGYFSLNTGLAIGSFTAFLLHVQDMVPLLREILDKYQQFQNSLTSAERVFHLLEEPIEQNPDSFLTVPEKLDVSIRDLSFRYQEGLPLVLRDLSLRIPVGTRAALIGRTGSGKSTLISLLMRFYDPPLGKISVGGIELERWPRQELRRKIGLVQQDPFIFRGTIFDNVALGNEAITSAAVTAALDKIGYLQLLRRTGRSLDSVVEEKGANLSAGERQLIAFARVMAYQPELLILDEATANVDSETEAILQRATETILQGRTSIVIAHRPSTVQNSDLIFVLDHGKLIEQGKPADLIKSRGVFYQYLQESLLQQ